MEPHLSHGDCGGQFCIQGAGAGQLPHWRAGGGGVSSWGAGGGGVSSWGAGDGKELAAPMRASISVVTQVPNLAREGTSSCSGVLEKRAARPRHGAEGSAMATSSLPSVNPRMIQKEQTPIRTLAPIMVHPSCRPCLPTAFSFLAIAHRSGRPRPAKPR